MDDLPRLLDPELLLEEVRDPDVVVLERGDAGGQSAQRDNFLDQIAKPLIEDLHVRSAGM
jgi:hypothetical protein